MLRGDNFAWLRLESCADLTTPRAMFEALVQPAGFLDGRNVLPDLVVARTVSMMQRIENAKPRLPRTFGTEAPNRPVAFLEILWSGMHRTVPARSQSCQSPSDTALSY